MGESTSTPEMMVARPRIDMRLAQADRVAIAGTALARAGEIFVRGGTIMQAPSVDEAQHGKVRILPHTVSTLRSRASVCVCYYKQRKTKTDVIEEEIPMPVDDAQAILQSARYPEHARIIDRVSSTPLLLRDGRVVSQPGYDAESRTWMTTRARSAPLPAVEVAVDALWELVDQVPFSGGREGPAFGAWVAGLLTPYAQALYTGCAPALLMEANVQGTGKSRLAEILQRIAYGRVYASSALPRTDSDQKRLFALAVDGVPCVYLDNLKGKVSSPILEAQMTSTVCADRIMREHRYEQVHWTPLWLLTGNNARLSRDMADRMMRCLLVSDEESPRTKGGWRIVDHGRYIAEREEALQGACLSILRHAQKQGWPRPDQGLWGSFEAWSGVVLSALQCAGIADPRDAAGDEWDEETDALSTLLTPWPPGLALTPLQLADMAGGAVSEGLRRALREAHVQPQDLERTASDLVEGVASVAAGRNAQSIGMLLSQLRDRWCAGKRLVRGPRTGSRRVWTVEVTEGWGAQQAVTSPHPDDDLPF